MTPDRMRSELDSERRALAGLWGDVPAQRWTIDVDRWAIWDLQGRLMCYLDPAALDIPLWRVAEPKGMEIWRA